MRKGIYDGNKFIVLAESQISKDTVKSYRDVEKRNEIIENTDTVNNDQHYLLKENIEFNSPSAASSFCRGNSTNGWKDWKKSSGETIDDVLRNNKT